MSRAVVRILVALVALVALEAHAAVHLVAIGANRGEPDETPLLHAERDASLFAGVMRRLGGAEDVVELYGEDANAVRGALQAVGRRLGPGSQLVIYYSGHADARGLHLTGTLLPYRELESTVLGLPARVRVLILDACRSGAATRVKGTTAGKDFVVGPESPSLPEGTAIITSSAAGEDSHESDRLRGSFFTHHLVTGLRGAADRNADGRVTLGEAYDYAYHQTLRASGTTPNLQHPTFSVDLRGRTDVELTRLDRDKSRSGRLAFARGGNYLVLEEGDAGAVAAELTVPAGGGSLLLPPGTYFVQRRDRTAYEEWTLCLTAGATVAADSTPGRTVAYARLLRKGGHAEPAVHGLLLMGAGRGGVLGGVGGHGVLAYTIDLPALTLGVRVRGGGGDLGGTLESTTLELGMGLTVERVIDLAWLSLAFGVAVEGVLHHQRFESRGDAPARTGWGVGFAALLALERELGAGWLLRLEAGPIAQVLEKAVVTDGVVTGSEWASPVTWWFAGGLGWRF